MKRSTLLLLLAARVLTCAGDNEFLWRDPGRVEELDLAAGPGGKLGYPSPPFEFIEEDLSGSSPKIFVRDAERRVWNVKFGQEVRSETFASRIPWAMGYFAEANYFVAQGRVTGVRKLSKRTISLFALDGGFANARFQLRDPELKFIKGKDWSWDNNPFVNTPQLTGLKILVMLTSNWDNKDARDHDEGTNTAIFEHVGHNPQYIYAFTDWGQSMGRWGNFFRRTQWKCADYSGDTKNFVRGVKNGVVEFGYAGRHGADFRSGIRVEEVRWLLQYLGRLTDRQIRDALRASGAKPDEAECFTRELRRRIERLQAVSR